MLARKKLAAIARKKHVLELLKNPPVKKSLPLKAKAMIKAKNAKGPMSTYKPKYQHRDSKVEINRPDVIPSKDHSAKNFPTMYTGDKLLGIGVAHKSCLVPIFSSQEAIDLARMRR